MVGHMHTVRCLQVCIYVLKDNHKNFVISGHVSPPTLPGSKANLAWLGFICAVEYVLS